MYLNWHLNWYFDFRFENLSGSGPREAARGLLHGLEQAFTHFWKHVLAAGTLQ